MSSPSRNTPATSSREREKGIRTEGTARSLADTSRSSAFTMATSAGARFPENPLFVAGVGGKKGGGATASPPPPPRGPPLPADPAEPELQSPPHGRPGAGQRRKRELLPGDPGREDDECRLTRLLLGHPPVDESDLRGDGVPERPLHVLLRTLVEKRDPGSLAQEEEGRNKPREPGLAPE